MQIISGPFISTNTLFLMSRDLHNRSITTKSFSWSIITKTAFYLGVWAYKGAEQKRKSVRKVGVSLRKKERDWLPRQKSKWRRIEIRRRGTKSSKWITISWNFGFFHPPKAEEQEKDIVKTFLSLTIVWMNPWRVGKKLIVSIKIQSKMFCFKRVQKWCFYCVSSS